jgi:hypothetical protein
LNDAAKKKFTLQYPKAVQEGTSYYEPFNGDTVKVKAPVRATRIWTPTTMSVIYH